MTYCHPDDHTWEQVVDGPAYDPEFDTQVCTKCDCHRGARIRSHPEVHTVTTAEGAEIAAQFLDRAAAELRAGDYSHVDVWIDSARPWLPDSTH